MLQKPYFSILATAFSLSFSLAAHAVDTHVIAAPQCLIKKVASPYQVLATNPNFVLVQTDSKGINAFIRAKTRNHTVCGGFIDATQAWKEYANKNNVSKTTAFDFLTQFTQQKSVKSITASPYTIKYEAQVNALLPQINPQFMWNNLTELTNFKDRYANNDTGVQAANWIKNQIETIAKENNREDVQVYFVKTGDNYYPQPSVVAKFGNSNEPGIVIGAHIDTVEAYGSSKKPGADDDGSGSATVLEAARTILASGMRFKKPIYFIWYAAEEEGLVGSGFVVNEFKNKKIPVDAVLHFDLTGYAYKNQSTMWVMDDYVDTNLTNYIEKLITTYVKQPVKHSRCGYACSDHATWHNAGYAAALPAEAAYENTNPDIHSGRDSMDKLSLTHMTNYAQLATAFAVELAEPEIK